MKNSRREFLKSASLLSANIGLMSIAPTPVFASATSTSQQGRIGIVGLDTSHAPAYARIIRESSQQFAVTAAYTTVSHDIPDSANRVDRFTQRIADMDIPIVPTIDDLLGEVDYVILSTIDGRKHLEQVEQILSAGKKIFVDKPMAGSLDDVLRLFDRSSAYDIPIFSSSAMRVLPGVNEVRNGQLGTVTGSDTYSPIKYEPTHPELFWYGLHGIEMMVSVMRGGCDQVRRIVTDKFDIVTADWGDGRIGTYRGIRDGNPGYGGRAIGEKGVVTFGKWNGFDALTDVILQFFANGVPPVQPAETIEIYAIMEAAHESSRTNGNWVSVHETLDRARERVAQTDTVAVR